MFVTKNSSYIAGIGRKSSSFWSPKTGLFLAVARQENNIANLSL